MKEFELNQECCRKMKRAKDKKEHMNSRGVTAHEDIKVRTRRTRRERIKNLQYIGGRNNIMEKESLRFI